MTRLANQSLHVRSGVRHGRGPTIAESAGVVLDGLVILAIFRSALRPAIAPNGQPPMRSNQENLSI